MTAPETVHLSKSVSGALVDFGDVAGSYEYILKSTADANVAAALLAAAGECYDREDARAIARLATEPQTDALQAMIDTARTEGFLEGFLASHEGYNGEYPFGDDGESPDNNEAWIAMRDKVLAKIGGAS